MTSKKPYGANGKSAPLLLLAPNAPDDALRLAERCGCTALHIPEWELLPHPVCSHPDMLIALVPQADGSTALLLPEGYYRLHPSFWDALNLPILRTDISFEPSYPSDVRLNLLAMQGVLFGRIDQAAPELLAAYPKHRKVRQGYARCSVLKLTESAAITADQSLAAALSDLGAEVLRIRSGFIRLEGYEYGFIGGASFQLPNRQIGLFGDLSAHPDGERMTDFAKRHGVTLISLPGALTDFGGGILLS